MLARIGLIGFVGATACLVGLGCGSGGGSAVDAAVADAATSDGPSADGGPIDAAVVDSGSAADGALADATAPDAAPPCGCGAGQYCDPLGVCQSSPGPTGALCGPTATCNEANPSFPDCLDAQCTSNLCAPAAHLGLLLLRNVCTRGCLVYKDTNGNGVNDLDAPTSDCRPPAVHDGPAGSAYRCVNHADPQSNQLGYCLPGTEFTSCSANRDCPADESCALTSIGGEINLRCVARYRENDAWSGTVSRLGQACNGDIAQGPLVYCQDGPCLSNNWCAAFCTQDADCDTTVFTPGQRCLGNVCENDASVACSIDADCSTAECAGNLDLGGGVVFTHCSARP